MSRESRAREAITMHGQSLHQRGFVPGSSGNISMRLDDGVLVTPTNVCLGRLDPVQIAKLDLNGVHVGGDAPSKEAFLHASMYARSRHAAVVHLHSTHAVAVACICDPNSNVAPIPPITPYFVMKIGQLKVLPYFAPGATALAHAVAEASEKHHAILLANHGPVVAGSTLDAAVFAIEELEEAAKLHLLLDGHRVNTLTSDQVQDLHSRFPS
ncbi:MAG: 3-oxo-tetronate 4-phosphate decarboxylase [Pseudomonadota bacterium]